MLYDAYGNPIPERESESDRQRPGEEPNSSNDKRDNRQVHREPPQCTGPSINDHITSITNSTTDNHQPNKKTWREYVPEWGTFLATLLAFLAAFWYARIANRQKDLMYRQWQTMHYTYSEVQKQTRAAQSTAEATIQQLKGTQAAVIQWGISIVQEGMFLTLVNNGHVAARNVRVKLVVSRQHLPGGQNIVGPISYQFYRPNLQPPEANMFQRLIIIDGWTLRVFNAVMDTAQTVRVERSLNYDDGFGDPISEAICESYLSFRATNEKGGEIGTSGFLPCDGFSAAARTAIRAKTEEATRNAHK